MRSVIKQQDVDPDEVAPGAYHAYGRPVALNRNENNPGVTVGRTTDISDDNSDEESTSASHESISEQRRNTIKAVPVDSQVLDLEDRVVQEAVDRFEDVLATQSEHRERQATAQIQQAVEVPEASPDTKSDSPQPKRSNSEKTKQTIFCIIAAGICLIIVVAGIAAGFSLTSSDQDEPNSAGIPKEPINTTSPTRTPLTSAVSTLSPTTNPPISQQSPTVQPTSKPSAKPSSTIFPTSSDRLTAVKDILYGISGEALDDETSPQHEAMTWLVYDDLRQVPVHPSSLPELIERYIVALMYYAMDGPYWNYSYGFLSHKSICDWYTLSVLDEIVGVTCDVTRRIDGIFLGRYSVCGISLH